MTERLSLSRCPLCATDLNDGASLCVACGARDTGSGDWVHPSDVSAALTRYPRTNPLAIVSIVLGVVGFGWFGAAGAIVCGNRAWNQIHDSAGTQTGAKLARFGIFLGWMGLAAMIWMFVFNGFGPNTVTGFANTDTFRSLRR